MFCSVQTRTELTLTDCLVLSAKLKNNKTLLRGQAGWMGGWEGIWVCFNIQTSGFRSSRMFTILTAQHRQQLQRRTGGFSPDFEDSGYAAIFNVALWSVWCGMAGLAWLL